MRQSYRQGYLHTPLRIRAPKSGRGESEIVNSKVGVLVRARNLLGVMAFLFPNVSYGETMFLPGCSDVLSEGSANVLVEGKPAARVSDRGSCGAFTLLGSSSVRINGKPAVRVGDQVQCANGKIGVILDGASSVFVEGKPLATVDSQIDGC